MDMMIYYKSARRLKYFMTSRILKLAKEDYRYDLPELILSSDNVNITPPAGMFAGVYVDISSSDGSLFTGTCVTESQFFFIQNPEIKGSGRLNIKIDLRCKVPGDVVKGIVTIITDIGIKEVYITAVCHSQSDAADNFLKTFEDFLELSSKDYIRAYNMFISRSFSDRFLKDKPYLYDVREGLMKSSSDMSILEEFLKAARYKKSVKLSLQNSRITISKSHIRDEHSLTIKKDSWGYSAFTVKSTADFLIPYISDFTTDDFMDDSFSFRYQIKKTDLKEGVNTGSIIIEGKSFRIKADITVNNQDTRETRREKQEKAFIKEITDVKKLLVRWYFGNIKIEEYTELMREEADKIDDFDHHFADLLKFHIDIVNGNNDTVLKFIDYVDRDDPFADEPEHKKIYTFFLGRFSGTDRESLIEDLKAEKSADPDSILIRIFVDDNCHDRGTFFSLMELAAGFVKEEPEDKLHDDNDFTAGYRHSEEKQYFFSKSLVMSAVCKMFSRNPSLFERLSLPISRCVEYGIKEHILFGDSIERFTYFAGNIKTEQKKVFSAMKELYRSYENDSALNTYVTLLVRAGKRESEYHEWYYRAAKKNLKVTGAFENYIYTFDFGGNEIIPDSVISYFTFGTGLNVSYRTRLYAYVIRHKKKMKSAYDTLKAVMQDFARDNFKKKNINADLGVLYDEFIRKRDITKESAQAAAFLMSTFQITVKSDEIAAVIVSYREFSKEETTPVIDNKALIHIYSSDAVIFLSDKRGIRYADPDFYDLKRVGSFDKYADTIESFLDNIHEGLILNLYDKACRHKDMEKQEKYLAVLAFDCKDTSAAFRQEIYPELIHRLYESGDNDVRLLEMLNDADLSLLSNDDRKFILKLSAEKGLYDKAYDGVVKYGYDLIDIEKLSLISADRLKEKKKDSELLSLACWFFEHDAQEPQVLNYLGEFYTGTPASLAKIYEAMDAAGCELFTIAEHLIETVVFTGVHLHKSFEVFRYYMKNSDKDNAMIRAFLNMNAYNCLVHGWILPSYMFDMFRKSSFAHDSYACVIAALMNLSLKDTLTPGEKEYAEKNLEKLVNNHMYFRFFRDFYGKVKLPGETLDMTYISYYSGSHNTVTITYMISSDGQDTGFVTENMPEVFKGMRTSRFMLFHDEILQYYITEEDPQTGRRTITESRCIRNKRAVYGNVLKDTRFHNVNSLISLIESHDDAGFMDMLTEYVYKNDLARNFLKGN